MVGWGRCERGREGRWLLAATLGRKVGQASAGRSVGGQKENQKKGREKCANSIRSSGSLGN
jgi:hypothetical protein